ncbi:MAG: type II toxin-antitoxin system RelE/ParE family toxin [Treponema sp.]|nr:type II toxin-antitoxin system RelE/ParE family toxin [Treponema sp.]MCL2250547.1 type II toxin-antitoxin system RelE/ParE family toxin [Treponema sp.]
MPQNSNVKVLTVYFYKSHSGNEPVRDWLKLRTPDEKKAIGEDLKMVEYSWPVGYPQVVKLDKDLWEVRTNLPQGISRIFFTVWERYIVLLHSIIKKTQKTPKQDLETAKKRRNRVLSGGNEDEK